MIKAYIEEINSKIKSKTKEQWVDYLNEKIRFVRNYIQEHGELGFVLAFILGIFVVVFFKFAFAMFFIAALIMAMIWCLAESDIEKRDSMNSGDFDSRIQ